MTFVRPTNGITMTRGWKTLKKLEEEKMVPRGEIHLASKVNGLHDG